MKMFAILALVSFSSISFADSNCGDQFRKLTRSRQGLAELNYHHLLRQGSAGSVELSSGETFKNLTPELIQQKTAQYAQSYEQFVVTCSKEATICGNNVSRTMQVATRYGVDAAKEELLYSQLPVITNSIGQQLTQWNDSWRAQNRVGVRTGDYLEALIKMTISCFEAVKSK